MNKLHAQTGDAEFDDKTPTGDFDYFTVKNVLQYKFLEEQGAERITRFLQENAFEEVPTLEVQPDTSMLFQHNKTIYCIVMRESPRAYHLFPVVENTDNEKPKAWAIHLLHALHHTVKTDGASPLVKSYLKEHDDEIGSRQDRAEILIKTGREPLRRALRELFAHSKKEPPEDPAV